MVKLIKSITKSVKHGVRNDPEVQRIKNKHPKLFRFIKKRFTVNEKYGLYLTIGITITLIFIYTFFGILQDYIGREALIQFDLRVINLFSLLRHQSLTNQMLFITYLAKGQIITLGVIIFLLIFYIYKKWHFMSTMLISVTGAEIFVWIIKNIIERPRPPLTNALIAEPSYSFPSGHTFVAIAFYGLLAYFVIQSEKNKFIKIISFILATFLIILVGLSRTYLGDHWPSDVFASFAAGLAWLTILITSLKIKKKFNPPQKFQPHLSKTKAIIFSLSLISIWVIFIIFFYLTHPIQTPNRPIETKTIIKTEEITDKLFENLPKVSESIRGLPAEPINIIFVGQRQELDNAFINSDWYLLDEPSIKSYTKIITSIILKVIYPQTPGLPVFWDTQPSQFAYGKPTSLNSVSSREHIHLWDTNFITENNQLIWVGTAHFDEEIQKKFGLIMPYHYTNPKVDDERESIKNELEKNGFIKSFEKINITGLSYGTKKGSGNSFLTDGQAYILYLQNLNETRQTN
jgi:membrane-associated phospholipid phosphatase